MVTEQLKLLINLARVDGEVADQERIFIRNIGVANGLSGAEIQALFEREHKPVVPSGLTAQERFDYILSLVQLMKIDERLYKDEVKFCAHVAAKLGYNEMAVFELMLNVKATMAADEKKTIQELVKQYLNLNS